MREDRVTARSSSSNVPRPQDDIGACRPDEVATKQEYVGEKGGRAQLEKRERARRKSDRKEREREREREREHRWEETWPRVREEASSRQEQQPRRQSERGGVNEGR